MMQIIGFALCCALLLILGICLVRTMRIQDKTAVGADMPDKPDEADYAYGEKLGRMLRCETVSHREQTDLGKFYAFHAELQALFPHVHAACERHEFEGSLLFRWKGRDAKEAVLLMSHHDVVEAGGEWKYPPFSGQVAEDAVWGRGAVDTKGDLFCMMQAAEELIAAGYMPACDIYIASSCTEEFGGPGAGKIAAYLKEQGVHLRMLLDEGGMIMDEPIKGLRGTYGMVGVLEKGTGNIRFLAKGKGGHASVPEKNGPLVRLGALMQSIESDSPFYDDMPAALCEMLRRFAPAMKFSGRFIFANLWLFRPALIWLLPRFSPALMPMMHTTIAFTTAGGSKGLNVLPQEAFVTANLRFMPHQGPEESIAVLAERAHSFGIETEIINAGKACPEVDYRGAAFGLLEKTMKQVYPGVKLTPYVMTGATDARFYTDVCDNCLRFAPLYITRRQYESIHAADENISLAALGKGVQFFKAFIHNL